jgi:UDP-galactopyranose mutase
MADDILCLSHLRWDFVFQRPQHLMTRFARDRRVFYLEEPIYDSESPELVDERATGGVHTVVPHLSPSLLEEGSLPGEQTAQLRRLLDDFLDVENIRAPVLWYYTPMALPFSRHVEAAAVVYDCMDELSAFAGAPRRLVELEAELFRRADLVFTGGRSLYETKRERHPSVHCFPSSVDVEHFKQARSRTPATVDGAIIPRPRLGFYGVIDERMDLSLLEGLADARTDWHIVLIGPVTKIEEEELPRRPNLHYLGPKSYRDLPAYLAEWDVALLPFARNASTRFISPTKTPEYLAAGKPVVSTSIQDVIHPYGERGLVRVADTVDETIAAINAVLDEDGDERQERADSFLAGMSWNRTWMAMDDLLAEVTQATELEAAGV